MANLKAKQKAAHELTTGNKQLQKLLANQYKASRDSEIVRKGWGLPVDGLKLWEKRLSLYSDPPPVLKNETGVPKDLTCAICAGCGRKSYYLCDGPPLRAHPTIKGLFYCSVTCRDVDAGAQRARAEYAEKGVWKDPGAVPGQCWVTSSTMRVERQLLRRNPSLQTPLTAEQIKERSARERARELAASRAAAAREKAASAPGYDGERPCCWPLDPIAAAPAKPSTRRPFSAAA